MATENKIHPVQAKILVDLLFGPEVSFSKLLKGTQLTSDHFSFHLNKLTGLGLIKKTKKGGYCLTIKGKEFANRFDTQKKIVEKQAKLGVLIVCVKNQKGVTQYLIQQRLKQPYYGFWGFISGKISWGETTKETAARELKEEAGLSANMKFLGIEHKMDYSQKKELLEDKYFYIFRAEKPKGNLRKSFKGGKNVWKTYKEIAALKNLFKDVKDIVAVVDRNRLAFSENKFFEKVF